MRHLVHIALLSLIPFAARAQENWAPPPPVDTTPEFVFEGDVDYVDPVLRADIGPPRVLSGTLKLEDYFLAEGPELLADSPPAGQGVFNSEITLDRNFVLTYEAQQAARSVAQIVEVIDGEAKEKDDIILFYIPMSGKPLPDSNFTIESLLIKLTDDDGKMVDSTGPFYTAPAYKEATFELIFINHETGETAKASGPITLFANLDRDVTPQEDYQQLEEQIRELDEKLAAKEKLIADLQTRLGLQDIHIKTRDEKIAALQAENDQLRSGEAIQVMEKANAALLDRLDKSQEAREFSAATVSQMTVRQEFLAKDNAELAKTNTNLRDELASALTELGTMRNQQEMLARQANVAFQETLPRPSRSSNLPLATLPPQPTKATTATLTVSEPRKVTSPSPPSSANGSDTSMAAMAMAAVNASQTTKNSSPTPGAMIDTSNSNPVVTKEEAQGEWRFPLPTVAQIYARDTPPPPTRGVAIQDTEEDDSNRVIRRGPRR